MPSKKGQALLAVLATPPGQPHRRDKLATMLWSGLSEEAARQNLRQCLTALRRGCQGGEVLPVVAEDGLLRLDTARVVVDVGEFEQALRIRNPETLARAFALYRGELLEGLNLKEGPFEEWLIGERRRLNALAVGGLSELLRHQHQEGKRGAAIQTALRLLTLDPLQENVHRSLMRLYHESGSTAQALRQYAVCEKTLRSELAVEPEDATQELRRDILQSRRVSSLSKVASDIDPGSTDQLPVSISPEEATSTAVPQDRPSVAVLPFANLSRNVEPLPDKPSIAVLPFQNMSGDPEQEDFADGMVEDIITALSRFKSLFVIARNSSFTFKGRAVDIKELGRTLGVRYVLEGSVRKASGKVRITGQLIDATTGGHLWADRFERDLTDIFALQDEVTVAVVSAIQPKLLQTEIEIAIRRRPENLTAYDLFLRAMQQYYQLTRESLAEASRLAHRALELDPRFGFVAALAGLCHTQNVLWGYAVDPQFERKEAVRLLRLALSIDDSDPDTLAVASVTRFCRNLFCRTCGRISGP